ncbi:unnamed protein product [Discosporangium mesarthrocarpum]
MPVTEKSTSSEMNGKRKQGTEEDEDESSDDDVGPMPAAPGQGGPDSDSDEAGPPKPVATKPKKKRRLVHEKAYLDALPSAQMYEQSYMHRDVVTHALITPCGTDFLVTASADGHLKFWKKMPERVEFVKHYHAHLEPINDVVVSADGQRLCTTSMDKTIKFYDVISFDMSRIISLEYTPTRATWIHERGRQGRVAVADSDSPVVRVYASDGQPEPVGELSVHSVPVVVMGYNEVYRTVVSADRNGVLEYWGAEDLGKPPVGAVKFKWKMDTDLYDLAKAKTRPCSVTFSPDGSSMAITSRDKQVRVFDFRTGRLRRKYDETRAAMEKMLLEGSLKMEAMDHGKKTAVERELEVRPVNTSVWFCCTILYNTGMAAVRMYCSMYSSMYCSTSRRSNIFE